MHTPYLNPPKKRQRINSCISCVSVNNDRYLDTEYAVLNVQTDGKIKMHGPTAIQKKKTHLSRSSHVMKCMSK